MLYLCFISVDLLLTEVLNIYTEVTSFLKILSNSENLTIFLRSVVLKKN